MSSTFRQLSPAERVRQAIKNAGIYIANNDTKKLSLVLATFKLDKVNSVLVDNIMIQLLTVAFRFQRIEATKLLTKNWANTYPSDMETSVNFVTTLFPKALLDTPILAFIVKAMNTPSPNLITNDADEVYEAKEPVYSYEEMMDELISMGYIPNVVFACHRGLKIFGAQPLSTYEMLRQRAEFNNKGPQEQIMIFLDARIEENSPFQPIPDWVHNFIDGPVPKNIPLPEEPVIDVEIPPLAEAIALLRESMLMSGLTFEDENKAIDYMKEILESDDVAEKHRLLDPILKQKSKGLLEFDTNIFRLFGPANPLINQDLNGDTINALYGGCRMYLCDIFDFDDESQLVIDWYDGACDQCHKRIRVRWHATRLPRPQGGWTNCFCSWQCTKDFLWADDYAYDDQMIVSIMIDNFEEQMSKTGIQDRTASEILF